MKLLESERDFDMTKEEIIRRYYSGWENQDWDAIASVLAQALYYQSQ